MVVYEWKFMFVDQTWRSTRAYHVLSYFLLYPLVGVGNLYLLDHG